MSMSPIREVSGLPGIVGANPAIDNFLINIQKMWPAGVMDSAPDYGSGGSRFESWVGRILGA